MLYEGGREEDKENDGRGELVKERPKSQRTHQAQYSCPSGPA